MAGDRLGFFLELLATVVAPILCALGLATVVVLNDQLDRLVRVRTVQPTWAAYRRTLRSRLHDPKVYKLLTWTMLLFYPSIARKSLAIFDCLDAGNGMYLLRDDPVLECFSDKDGWYGWAALAGLGIGVYCIGLPLAAFVAAWLYHCSAKDDLRQRERVVLIVGNYESKFWYCESIVLLHRFFFTGLIHLLFAESRLQLFIGSLGSLLTYIGFLLTRPFHHDICDAIGGAALLQLLLTYVSAMLFFDDGLAAGSAVDDSAVAQCDWQAGRLKECHTIGGVLVAANSICFVLLALAWARSIYSARRTAAVRRVRYVDNDEPAKPTPLTKGEIFHLFLSHSWVSGQDTMRIVKQRLLEMMPSLSVFLDVDIEELDIGNLEGYVDASQAVLVFCSAGYFTSRNCMRELKQSALQSKRLIAMLDPEARKGGLGLHEVQGLALSAGGEAVASALFAEKPIEWNRLGFFQDVTLKLVAERLLPEKRTKRATRFTNAYNEALAIYYTGERKKLRQLPKIPPPRRGKRFHLFVSRHNPGAEAFAHELGGYVQMKHGLGAGRRLLRAISTKATGGRHLLVSGSGGRRASIFDYFGGHGASQPAHRLFPAASAKLSKETAPAELPPSTETKGVLKQSGAHLATASGGGGGGGSSGGGGCGGTSGGGGCGGTSGGGSGGGGLHARFSAAPAAAAPPKPRHQDSSLSAIHHTSSVANLRDCELFLLYLNAQTWASGPARTQLVAELARALIDEVPLLLVHEQSGIDGHLRHGCEFDAFFQYDATPPALLRAGVYASTAISLKGGPWRPASLAVAVQKLEKDPLRPTPQPRRMVEQLETLIMEADKAAGTDEVKRSEASLVVLNDWASGIAGAGALGTETSVDAGQPLPPPPDEPSQEPSQLPATRLNETSQLPASRLNDPSEPPPPAPQGAAAPSDETDTPPPAADGAGAASSSEDAVGAPPTEGAFSTALSAEQKEAQKKRTEFLSKHASQRAELRVSSRDRQNLKDRPGRERSTRAPRTPKAPEALRRAKSTAQLVAGVRRASLFGGLFGKRAAAGDEVLAPAPRFAPVGEAKLRANVTAADGDDIAGAPSLAVAPAAVTALAPALAATHAVATPAPAPANYDITKDLSDRFKVLFTPANTPAADEELNA